MVSVRKTVLLAVDLASTVLTLMTGLRENPVLVLLTGRYDLIRSRLLEGRVNYESVRDGHFNTSMLPDLVAAARSHRFYSAPDRTRANLAEDRSTCMNVNSMSTPVLTLNYDDFFGKGARREQIFVYSISAPHCAVVNFKLGWYDRVLRERFAGNATACHAFILDEFEALHSDRSIQAGAPVDFGERGTPFLKCVGRPLERFLYLTDLIVHQSYWAGGSYHLEFQTSRCWALPLARHADWQWGLFRTAPADESASVVFAVDPVSDVAFVISVLYGITSIAMILRGLFVAFSLSNLVVYVPSSLRRRVYGLQLPVMALSAKFTRPTARMVNMVLCRGENLMASDLWMNHWFYITLSILDALCNVRTTYIVLEMGSWMLTKKNDFANFTFVCAAITKLTWIMCFVHTVFRAAVQVVVRVLHSLSWLRHARVLGFVSWYVDSVAMFMSYKLYSVMLSTCLLVIYSIKKTTTIMVHQEPYKQPVYGGFPDLANFWGNEIICDLFVLCSVQLVVAHVLVALALLTRYRRATRNRVLQLLQERFFFVGWDAMVVMEALGIDPLDDSLVTEDDVASTNCSLGALIQQLYTSGPSGLVEFVGDSAFLARGSVGKSDRERGIVRYPLETAHDMGLLKPAHANSAVPIDMLGRRHSSQSSIWQATDAVGLVTAEKDAARRRSSATASSPVRPLVPVRAMTTPSIATRHLHVHAEWRWGRILLVDFTDSPGELCKNQDGTLLEFVVQDALMLARKDDVGPLLSTSPSLRIA